MVKLKNEMKKCANSAKRSEMQIAIAQLYFEMTKGSAELIDERKGDKGIFENLV